MLILCFTSIFTCLYLSIWRYRLSKVQPDLSRDGSPQNPPKSLMIHFIWWIWLFNGEVCIFLYFQTSYAAMNLWLRQRWHSAPYDENWYIYIYVYVSDACYLEEFFHLSQLLDFLAWDSVVISDASQVCCYTN